MIIIRLLSTQLSSHNTAVKFIPKVLPTSVAIGTIYKVSGTINLIKSINAKDCGRKKTVEVKTNNLQIEILRVPKMSPRHTIIKVKNIAAKKEAR